MKKVKDANIYLYEIVEFADDIRAHIKGYIKASFLKDKKTQDAVIRKIEIIGEIAKRLPSVLKNNSAHIPWKDIAGMRDILIHEYAGVDLNETWVVVTVDIPKLQRDAQKILKQIEKLL